MATNEEMREYIRKRCRKDETAGCWLWMYSLSSTGYGQAVFKREHILAHRLSYVAFNGPIPDGMLVQHSCDVPRCVNPAHLSIGTDATNNWDKQIKGRAAMRLVREEVEALRKSDKSDVEMAETYGVSRSMIQKIRSRECWSHVPGGGTNRNPIKFGMVAACIARHLRRRGERIADIAHAFGTSEGYMQHIIARRRWTDWSDIASDFPTSEEEIDDGL